MRLTRKTLAALAAVSMVAMLSALDQTVVSTALPHILNSLEGASLLGWIFTAYFVGATATVAVVGKLADLFGRRGIFLVSVGLFSAGSLLCGIATSMPELVAFRGIQGIGAGAIGTCSLILMADMFPPRERGRWQVINSVGFATASAVGPTVGGFLSDNFSWRWIFLLNVPLCIATVAALTYGLSGTSQRTRTRPSIDWAGGTASTALIIAVLLICTWGGREYDWLSAPILVLGASVALLAALLLWAERRAPDPVIPGNLLRGNVRALSLVAGFGNSMVWFGMILLVPLRLELVLGASGTVAGALLTPGVVLGPVCSFVAGQLMARTGRYRLSSLIAGVAMVSGTAGLLLLPITIGQQVVIALFLLVCVGTGFGGPTFMIVYQNALPNRQIGAGVGVLSLFRQLGASLGTALAGSIVGAGVAAADPSLAAAAVQQAFALPLAAGVIVLVAAALTANRPLRATQHDDLDLEAEAPVRISATLAAH